MPARLLVALGIGLLGWRRAREVKLSKDRRELFGRALLCRREVAQDSRGKFTLGHGSELGVLDIGVGENEAPEMRGNFKNATRNVN
eukprot:2536435-Pyramimonas_sp.AAC.1